MDTKSRSYSNEKQQDPVCAKDMEEKGRPLQIVTVNKEGLFLDERQLDIILGRDDVSNTPVVILSVAGAYRTGKSFLLNFLRRYLERQDDTNWIGARDEPLSGFKWEQGAVGVTKGILMWSQPFPVKLEDGRNAMVLLVDTQGFYEDNVKHQPHDAAIFALSLLLSSTQVYNVLRNFQKPQFTQIESAVHIAQLTLALAQPCQERPFQRLYCLVRDWMGSEGIKFGKDAGMKYLGRDLETMDGFNVLLYDYKAVATTHVCQETELKGLNFSFDRLFNMVITIKDITLKLGIWVEHFSEKPECFLMPYPGEAVAEYKHSDDSSESEDEDDKTEFKGQPGVLTDRFKKKLKELVMDLLKEKRLLVKRINGEDVTGLGLASHFKTWKTLFEGASRRLISSDMNAFTEVFHGEFNANVQQDIWMNHRKQFEKIRPELEDVEANFDIKELEKDLSTLGKSTKTEFLLRIRGSTKVQSVIKTTFNELLRSWTDEKDALLDTEKRRRELIEQVLEEKHLYQEYISKYTAWIEAREDLMEEVQQQIKDLEKHGRNVNIARATGATVSGVGLGLMAAGVIFLPLLPIGGAVAAAGALTSGGAKLKNQFIESDMRREHSSTTKKDQKAYEEMATALQNINKSLKGMDEFTDVELLICCVLAAIKNERPLKKELAQFPFREAGKKKSLTESPELKNVWHGDSSEIKVIPVLSAVFPPYTLIDSIVKLIGGQKTPTMDMFNKIQKELENQTNTVKEAHERLTTYPK